MRLSWLGKLRVVLVGNEIDTATYLRFVFLWVDVEDRNGILPSFIYSLDCIQHCLFASAMARLFVQYDMILLVPWNRDHIVVLGYLRCSRAIRNSA